MILFLKNIFENFHFTGNKQDFSGAPARIRTADLLITNQLLYQLSYKGLSDNY